MNDQLNNDRILSEAGVDFTFIGEKEGAGYSGAAFYLPPQGIFVLLLLFMKPGITFAGQ